MLEVLYPRQDHNEVKGQSNSHEAHARRHTGYNGQNRHTHVGKSTGTTGSQRRVARGPAAPRALTASQLGPHKGALGVVEAEREALAVLLLQVALLLHQHVDDVACAPTLQC